MAMKRKSVRLIIFLICIAPCITQADIFVSDMTDTIVAVSDPNGEAVLSIEGFWAYRGWDCYGTTLDMENDVEVAALQVNILFDTECYDIQGVRKTSRTTRMDIFNYADIQGGIRIDITSPGGNISQGSGPIAVIYFQTMECHDYWDTWDITGAVAADPIGTLIPVSEIDNAFFPMHPGYKGDVNEDEEIDIRDAVLSARCILGLDTDVTEQGLWAADYNSDGVIDIRDIVLIVNEILRQTACPP
jgi:hypothetical protein